MLHINMHTCIHIHIHIHSVIPTNLSLYGPIISIDTISTLLYPIRKQLPRIKMKKKKKNERQYVRKFKISYWKSTLYIKMVLLNLA